jgi:hypothetical protein
MSRNILSGFKTWAGNGFSEYHGLKHPGNPGLFSRLKIGKNRNYMDRIVLF